MGLDIGIISIRYLSRPMGRAYDFAQELALQSLWDGYMSGQGNSWAPFTRDGVMAHLETFSTKHGLSSQEQTEVREWVESLPWEGDLIELHFNW